MGCDIHSVAQVRKDGVWKTVLQDVCGDPRRYDTFAMLANVRNGYGFAGCDTGDGFEPISEPRGFPDDFLVNEIQALHTIPPGTPSGNTYEWADPEYKAQREQETRHAIEVWMGDHSFSWLTLAEINAYINRKSVAKTKKRGWVGEATYLKVRGTNQWPEEWCGGAGGGNIESLTAETYEKHGPTPGRSTYVLYEWEVDVLECGYIRDISMELGRLAETHGVGPEDVRMVFGFDS